MSTKTEKKTARLRLRTMTKQGKTIHWYEAPAGTSAKGRGVTTLLSNGTPSGGLVKWAANCAADCALDEEDIWRPLAERDRAAAYDYIRNASDRDRDAAANRGSEVHLIAEQLMAGKEVEVPEEIEGHVDQFIAWHEAWQPELVASEFVIVNWTRWYFGKSDLLVKVEGWPGHEDTDALVLLDIKTSRSGPWEKDAVQLTAYRHAEEICLAPDDRGNCWDLEPMPAVVGVGVLHLSADAYSIHPVNEDLDQRLFAQFLHFVRVAEFYGSGWKAEDKGWSRDVFRGVLVDPETKF